VDNQYLYFDTSFQVKPIELHAFGGQESVEEMAVMPQDQILFVFMRYSWISQEVNMRFPL